MATEPPADTSTTTPTAARRVEQLFGRALELPPAERDEMLRRECGNDPHLFSEVNSLLEALSEEAEVWPRIDVLGAQILLEEGRDGAAPDHGMEPPAAAMEQREIGRYRLREEIGRGGMGVVYRATRSDGSFKQTVAVKLLYPGANAQALQRFTRERQILASLEHPSIARLLDGGISETGEAYLVVEYVQGRPLDAYCAEENPPLEQRLQLLNTLCDAVQAAHRRLVVHRDIKPSNILVRDDGQPKLLDFGIAKLIEGDNPEHDLTRTRQNPMTVQYASPEQFRGELVTVASDVYQLGLIAYELLSGTRPYDLRERSSADTLRLISEIEPAAPSTHLTPATRRSISPDLDTIVLKALAKEPQQRYASVADLQRDLELYLAGRPIQARRSTVAYRASRWFKRNALLAAIGGTACALLVGSSVAFTVQLVHERDRSQAAAALAETRQLAAEQSRDEAEQLVDFIATLFDRASPQFTAGNPVSALELLAAGRREIGARTFERPQTRARLLYTLGVLYRRYGEFDVAEELQRESLAQLGLEGVSTEGNEVGTSGEIEAIAAAGGRAVEALWETARLRAVNREFSTAVRLLEMCIAAVELQGGQRTEAAGNLLSDLASNLGHLGRVDEALEAAERAVASLSRSVGAEHESTALALTRRGTVLMERGEYERAREDLTKAVRILRVQKPGSTNLTSALSSLAIVYDRLGDPEKAEQLFDEADRVARLVFPVGHPERATAPSNRALILRRLGRPEEAERLLREILLELPSPPIPHLEGMVRNALAATLADLGRAQEALVEYDRGIALQRQTLPEGHPELGISLNNRGEAAALLGRGEEAERNFSMALDIFEARLGKQHFNVSYPLFNLAKLQRGRGALEEAEQLARQSFQIRDATQGAEGEDRKEALELWIELLADLGRGEELAAAEALRN